MRGKWIHALYYFNLVVQSLFSLLTPIALAVALAWFLTSRALVGEWIYAVLILIGVGIGLYSMVHFILIASAQIRALEAQNRSDPTSVDPKGDRS